MPFFAIRSSKDLIVFQRPVLSRSVGKILRDAGFKGYVSLEFEGKEDAATAIPKSLDLLRKSL
jgi:hypothetical protein